MRKQYRGRKNPHDTSDLARTDIRIWHFLLATRCLSPIRGECRLDDKSAFRTSGEEECRGRQMDEMPVLQTIGLYRLAGIALVASEWLAAPPIRS
jgi:hypothetical protein